VTDEPFETTPDGYQKAKEWLSENNLSHKIEGEQSADGFTLVALANHLRLVLRYERRKYENFRASSRLDGIELSASQSTESLADVIARHKTPPKDNKLTKTERDTDANQSD
jgi:hypothetical protein